MAQQNTGCGTGCGSLLAMLALGFVLAYWHIFLIAAVLVAAIAAVVYAVLLYNQQQLKQLYEAEGRESVHKRRLLRKYV
jgi:mannose/fructose/N-acetylgalactosamine-specific phosphotransferase system component IIC